MENIKITKINLTEIDQLQLIGKQTFFETFVVWNTEENVQKYLEKSFAFDKLKAELINRFSEFYFAIFENKAIGYLKINFGPAQTEIKDDKALEIERIYVLKEFQGKKIGQMLYDKAFDRAKQTNVDYLWLGVWEENHRAISFYMKNGFVAFDKHIFNLGDNEQTDILMKLKLKEKLNPLKN